MMGLKPVTIGAALIAAMAMQACEDGMKDQIGGYTIEMNDQIPDTCGLSDTISKLEADPNYLTALKDKNDPKYRIVSPNMPVTLDFRKDRQTIVVDEVNMTISMKCG